MKKKHDEKISPLKRMEPYYKALAEDVISLGTSHRKRTIIFGSILLLFLIALLITYLVVRPDAGIERLNWHLTLLLITSIPISIIIDIVIIFLLNITLKQGEKLKDLNNIRSFSITNFGVLLSFQIISVSFLVISIGYTHIMSLIDFEEAKFLVPCCFLVPILIFITFTFYFITLICAFIQFLHLYKTRLRIKIFENEN